MRGQGGLPCMGRLPLERRVKPCEGKGRASHQSGEGPIAWGQTSQPLACAQSSPAALRACSDSGRFCKKMTVLGDLRRAFSESLHLRTPLTWCFAEHHF